MSRQVKVDILNLGVMTAPLEFPALWRESPSLRQLGDLELLALPLGASACDWCSHVHVVEGLGDIES